MPRTRFWVIVIAILLSILGTLLPVLAAYYISWTRATKLQQTRLSEVTSTLIARVRRTYSDIESVLFYLNKQNITSPCSPEHIQLMRHETVNSPVIEEIEYLNNGYVQCGSWGTMTPTPVNFTDEIQINGVKISLDTKSIVTQKQRMISLRYGSYYALVNPLEFSNIMVDPEVKVALLSLSGSLIASSNNPDINFIKGYIAGGNQQEAKKYIISVTSGARFNAIATEYKSNFYHTLSEQQLIFLPLGLLLSLPIIGLIIYFSRRRLSIESELEYAIDNDKLTVHYQPIIDLKSGYCKGAEALIRWFPSGKESIPPDFFVAVAQKAGYISKITKYVISTVIRDMQSALVADKNLHISINFNVLDFQNLEIVAFLEEKLKGTGIAREQIWLEITEHQLVDFKTTAAMIEKIRMTGYKFAMDDFGTGYSNLSYLKNLSLDLIKIDKSFVDTIGLKTVTSGITEDIINMAQRLNLQIVAEGIETADQRDYLQERNVDYGQGWLFSKALSPNDFLAFIQRINKQIPMRESDIEYHS